MTLRRMIGAVEVSLAGLGTNNFGRRLDAARTREVVDAALDAGITHFDTADIYGDGLSEEHLGRALEARRPEVTIASKFGYNAAREAPGTMAEWAPRSLEASLRRLDVDAIDLYYYHKPDPTTPVAEVLELMNRMLAQGKVREIACSNFSAAQLDEAAEAAAGAGLRGFAAVQNQFSLLEREPERGVLDACAPGHGVCAVLPAGLRPAHRQVPHGPAGSGRDAPRWRWPPVGRGRRLAGDRGRRAAGCLRRGARPHAARAGALVDRRAPAGGDGDRRRHLARAGARKRRCDRRLAAQRG
jgi:aryl-alcohol dehydrogenase-like predicted oxidoreductase